MYSLLLLPSLLLLSEVPSKPSLLVVRGDSPHREVDINLPPPERESRLLNLGFTKVELSSAIVYTYNDPFSSSRLKHLVTLIRDLSNGQLRKDGTFTLKLDESAKGRAAREWVENLSRSGGVVPGKDQEVTLGLAVGVQTRVSNGTRAIVDFIDYSPAKYLEPSQFLPVKGDQKKTNVSFERLGFWSTERWRTVFRDIEEHERRTAADLMSTLQSSRSELLLKLTSQAPSQLQAYFETLESPDAPASQALQDRIRQTPQTYGLQDSEVDSFLRGAKVISVNRDLVLVLRFVDQNGSVAVAESPIGLLPGFLP
ncbi:MAG: hypothetical protein MUC92_01690 [Fimbriimonadaceae bacterium]|jgi:hypothetical protein|nr:hypothetical protein [Fimbriimonadaceae bacterium]